MPYVDGLRLELVRECLANRVPVNQPDQAGNTPLHWAARSHIFYTQSSV
jgi:ankyrin repeat protein